ncbi:unnamed protein product, partial [Ectocarpus sp. 12 AP-2014]
TRLGASLNRSERENSPRPVGCEPLRKHHKNTLNVTDGPPSRFEAILFAVAHTRGVATKRRRNISNGPASVHWHVSPAFFPFLYFYPSSKPAPLPARTRLTTL